LLLASAINGYPNSQYRLGSNLLRGEYTQTDRKKGLNWLLNAAQSGFSYAQYRLGRELLNKQTLEYDADKAKRWLKSAAQQGHFRALRDLVAIGLAEQDYQSAAQYLKLALAQDDEHPDLLLAQATILQQQKQYTQSKKKADEALKQAKSRQWYLSTIAEFIDTNKE
jgi:TPR repeat protein